MNCLGVDLIYMYVEGELSAAEEQAVKEHLSFCTKCHRAVEDRKLLVEASRTLPHWDIPPEFTQQVMSRIFPGKTPFKEWAAAASIGLTGGVLAFLAVFLLSGQNLVTFSINLSSTVLNLFRSITVVLIKLAKIISLSLPALYEIISSFIKGLTSLTTILNPELQIILIVLIVILSALLFYGAKRKFLIGEKT